MPRRPTGFVATPLVNTVGMDPHDSRFRDLSDRDLSDEVPGMHDTSPVSSGHPDHGLDRPVLVISCDTCIMQNSDACGDCMMSVLCDPPVDGAVVLSLEELREIRLLARAGLVPTLRHRAVG